MIPSRGMQWSSRAIGLGRRRLEDVSVRSFSSSTTRNARLSAAPFARGALSSKTATRPQFVRTSPILTQIPSRRFQSTTATTTATATTDSLADAAASSTIIPSSLDAALELVTKATDAPEHIGYLRSLGLEYGNGPTAIVEWTLEHTHVLLGTPWWASITLTAVLFRVLFLKFYLDAADNAARMATVQPQTKPLTDKMMEASRNSDQATTMAIRREIQVINRRAGVKVWKSFVPMVQVFTGYGTFRLIQAMAKVPVPGLENGGTLWFPNLTIPDPYFLLPVASAGVLHLVLRNGGETGTSSMSESAMKLMSYGFPIMTILFTFWLPAGLQLSFFITGLWSAIQVTLFRNKAFRSALGLTQLPPPPSKVPVNASPYRADILTVQQLRERAEAPTTTGVFSALNKQVDGVKDAASKTMKSAREYAGQDRKNGKRTKAEISRADAYEKKRQAEEKQKEAERRERRRQQRLEKQGKN